MAAKVQIAALAAKKHQIITIPGKTGKYTLMRRTAQKAWFSRLGPPVRWEKRIVALGQGRTVYAIDVAEQYSQSSLRMTSLRGSLRLS